MKPKRKSARIKALLAAVYLLGLAGCGDVKMPHVFDGNEVPQDVVDAPRPVEMPPPAPSDTGHWLRLGDVPSKPKDFIAPAASDKMKEQMEQDRVQSQIARQRLEPPFEQTQQPAPPP